MLHASRGLRHTCIKTIEILSCSGKTEVARRLAKLVNAPFIKVEATKYTELGYVGRDVEEIIKDLVEASVK